MVNIDLKNIFDEVDYGIPLILLHRTVKCPEMLRLIRKWPRTPISIKGKLTERREGVPQISPLSPSLSNSLLHELNKKLKQEGLHYTCYTDDFSIYKRQKLKIGKHYPYFREKAKIVN